MGPCGRGTVLCTRCSCGRRGRRPSRPVGIRKSTRPLGRVEGSARAWGPPFLADRGGTVPPNGPCGRGADLCARNSCGPRGRGPSHGALWEGHSPLCPIFLRTAGTPSLPTCRSSQGHPAIGCGCRFRRGARGLPFLADRGDAVPPMGPCGSGTVLCARYSRGRRGHGHIPYWISAGRGLFSSGRRHHFWNRIGAVPRVWAQKLLRWVVRRGRRCRSRFPRPILGRK
jgi:hypothetical protein